MILVFSGLTAILCGNGRHRTDALAYAIILFGSYVLAVTEIFSVFHILAATGLRLTYFLSAALLWGFFFFRAFRNKDILKKTQRDGIRPASLRLYLLVAWILFAIVVLFLSIRMVPYNWDSMTYHLTRIFYWAQNRSVEHYATNNLRQLSSPQLPAFVNLHVYLIYGSDRLLNLLQSFSYLINGFFVYEIADWLGSDRRRSILAAVLYYSMPIAAAEAFTTQVDEFAALIMLCFVWLLLPYLQKGEKLRADRGSFSRTLLLGLSVGLGYLSKPSVCISMAVFALFLLAVCIRRRDTLKICLEHIFMGGAGMLAVLLPEILRNYRTFGTPIPKNVGGDVLVGDFHIRHLIVNFYKNFTMNLPCSLLYKSNETVWKYGMRLARLLGVDIDHPAIAFGNFEYKIIDTPDYRCDTAVSPLIMWAVLVSTLLFLGMLIKRKIHGIRRIYFSAALLSFLFFCLVAKWQPWLSRFMLSYFAVLTPGITSLLCMTDDSERMKRAREGVPGCLLFLAVVELFGALSFERDLIREQRWMGSYPDEAYFLARPQVYEDYADAARYLNDGKYDKIGVVIGGEDYEYPLYRMLNKRTEVYAVLVPNESAIYEKTDDPPEVILADERDLGEGFAYAGEEYELTDEYGMFKIYGRVKQ